MTTPIRFQAVLETLQAGAPWTAARLPFDPAEAWPIRNKLRVKGSIGPPARPEDAVEFAVSLIRSTERGYFLLVTGKMRKAARLAAGSVAEISLEPDLEVLAATPPPELAKLLKADRTVKKWFAALTVSTRKYIAEQVAESKSPETRQRRAEMWMERLMLTMDGEESPPPILQIAFGRQPQAREGWYALTANQRRTLLLGIFSCVSPQAQQKRVERAIADAMQAAKRHSAKRSAPDSEE